MAIFAGAAGIAGASSARAAEAVLLPPVAVSASRLPAPLGDPSASVTTLTGDDLRRRPARSLDEALRAIPGFSLFRRLGSSAAHPTAQGVSLRGIGPSGTSRALVLVDGVPVNDPFGGWVYWSRLPTEAVESVEVLRGSASSLWGNYAMGGVVAVTTRRPEGDAGAFVVEGGERESGRAEGWLARDTGRGSVLADARWMRSGDFPVVRADARGPIDTAAGSEHVVAGLRAEHELSQRMRLRFQGRAFHETRDNGTPYTTNETWSGFLRTGADVEAVLGGRAQADLFTNFQGFSSTFSSVSADRSAELPAVDQFDVPSTSVGGSLVWNRDLADRHHLVVGADALWVEGDTRERLRFVDGAFTRQRDGGASQTMAGLFVGDLVRLGPDLDLTAALRLDHWRSGDGYRREGSLETGATDVDRDLADASETIVSPRVGLAWSPLADTVLRSAAYRGFRAPTINELVRPFRVRNDITEANEALDPETLLGVEAGLDHHGQRWWASATAFWNRVDDAIFNVTVGQGPGVVDPCGFVPAGGVCRQRRNLGRTQVVGVEADAGVRLGGGFELTAAWLWSDAEIRRASAEPALEGNRVPQVPRHQGTIGLALDRGGPWWAAVQLRVVGEQFDDDANTRRLDRFVTADLFASRELGRGFEVYVAAENVFDEVIESGRSADGVVSIAAPRIARIGLRYAFSSDGS